MKSNIITISNFLSISRILLLFPFIYFYEEDYRYIAFIIALIAISTDWFDGQVARRTNTVSELGKVLDPIADKICALVVVGYFLWKNELPLWFVLIVVVRDVAIFFGGIFLKYRYQVLTTALPIGKWAVGFLSLIFVWIIWPNPSSTTLLLKNACIVIATGLLLVSFVQYLWRMLNIIRGKSYTNL